MKKVFVKWGWCDDYGRTYEDRAYMEWFDTMEEAEAFVQYKKKGNGGYFYLWKIAEGNTEDFEKMQKLYKEYMELKKMF